jgi:hypothetical protein
MQFRDNTKPNNGEVGRPCVYVLIDHNGTLINVYREYITAVAAAIDQVTIDEDHTYIDNFEFSIYVQGDKGEVCIFMEELL